MNSRRALFVAALLLGSSGVAGCNAGKAFIASTGDYADYRRVRVNEELAERLAAASYYLEHRADGRFHTEVRAFFEHAEPIFYAVRRRSIKGLEAYLRALPHGPHATEALAELMELRHAERNQRLPDKRSVRWANTIGAQKRARRTAATLLPRWVRVLLNAELWQRPLDQAPAEFLTVYRLALPEPVCAPLTGQASGYRCRKSISRRFQVAGTEEPVIRELRLELELLTDEQWRLRQARLAGPSVLLRVLEAREKRALDGQQGDDRLRAAADFSAGMMLKLQAAPHDCMGQGNRWGGLDMSCGALSLTVRPAVEGREGEDEVLIVKTSPEPADAGEGESEGEDEVDNEGEDAEPYD